MKIDVHYAKDTFEGDLEELGMHVEYSEAQDREPIDFEVRNDRDDLCATVWGSDPFDDVQVDCEHDAVEFSDDDTVGECALCGAVCNWHWEVTSDGDTVMKERFIDGWDKPSIGGVIGKELKRLQKRW